MSLLLLFTSPQDGWQGALDEVAVYSSALSAARIRNHYEVAEVNPGFYSSVVLSDNPLGYWRFEDFGTIATDATGHGLNGTYAPSNGVILRRQVLGQPQDNQISLFFRQISGTYPRMMDLDNGSWTMARLDAQGSQPDFASITIAYPPREQSDMELFTQDQLDNETQFDLETKPNDTDLSWIEVRLSWNAADSTLAVFNTTGQQYAFSDLSLDANEDYILFADLQENGLRIRIYLLDHNLEATALSTTGAIKNLVYDTTVIVDDILFTRRQGRIGWHAQLVDSDALLYNIRPRRFNFAEVQTHPLRSITPVRGAQLFAGSTPDRQFFSGWFPGPFGGSIVPDTIKSNSGASFRVHNDGTKPLQGIASNSMYLDTFEDITISFKLNFPAAALKDGRGLECFLYGENGRVIPLTLPSITPDKWMTVTILLGDLQEIQTGPYSVVFVQSTVGIVADWYIDSFSVLRRSLTWAARSHLDNAWHEFGDTWVPFNDVYNTARGGVVFETPGNELQVRAQALTQDASIDNMRIVPQFAQFGPFVWSDQGLGPIAPPVPNIASVVSGKLVSLDGRGSTSQSRIALYEWDFGDGQIDLGSQVTHTYAIAGVYSVTLSVMDANGRRQSLTEEVVIS